MKKSLKKCFCYTDHFILLCNKVLENSELRENKNYKSSFRCLTFKVNISVLKCKLRRNMTKNICLFLLYFMIWNEFWDNTRICRLSHLAHPALGILNSCVAPIICHFILAICGAHRKRWKTRWVSCFHLESIMKYVMYFMQRNYAICSTDLHHYFLWKWTKFSWKLLENYSKSRMYFASEASYVYILSGQKLI